MKNPDRKMSFRSARISMSASSAIRAGLPLTAVAALTTERAVAIRRALRSKVIGPLWRLETFAGEVGSRTGTLSKVQAALESAGIEFFGEGRPGVRLRTANDNLRNRRGT